MYTTVNYKTIVLLGNTLIYIGKKEEAKHASKQLFKERLQDTKSLPKMVVSTPGHFCNYHTLMDETAPFATSLHHLLITEWPSTSVLPSPAIYSKRVL